MGYQVYIIRSEKTGQYYIGETSDIKQRLEKHNAGQTKSTKGKCPWQLIYSETYETLTEALKRERFLKKQKNKAFYNRLIEEQKERS